MPGANERAMEKAKTLDCDAIIFDLEDAVAAGSKAEARARVAAMVGAGDYGYRELVVRINGLDTPWGQEDLAVAAGLPVHALLFPKVESAAQVAEIVAAVDAEDGGHLPIWVMIETPKGVLDVREVAAEIGAAQAYANQLCVSDGHLNGEFRTLVPQWGKGDIVTRVMSQAGLSAADCIAVGDGFLGTHQRLLITENGVDVC